MKSAANWDAEFKAGKYAFLRRPAERARLGAIAAMIERSTRARRPVEIADLGCGEGLLLDFLDPSRVWRYVAVDISREALRAVPDGDIAVRRVRAGLHEWDGRPAPLARRILVASEVLYYHPLGVAHLKMLGERRGGASEAIVSCVAGKAGKPNWTHSANRLWRGMQGTGWRRIEGARVRDASADLAWDIARYAIG